MRCLENIMNNKSHSCCGAAHKNKMSFLHLCCASGVQGISASMRVLAKHLSHRFLMFFNKRYAKFSSLDSRMHCTAKGMTFMSIFRSLAMTFSTLALAMFFYFIISTKSQASQTWDCGDKCGNIKCTFDDDDNVVMLIFKK